MHNRLRHSSFFAAQVSSGCLRKFFVYILYIMVVPFYYLNTLVKYAYSYVEPPCFYSPSREHHFSIKEERDAIIHSLQHKQQKIIRANREKEHRIMLLVILALLMLIKHQTSAHASTTGTTNLNVAASVTARCQVNSGSLAFGSYDPTIATKLDVNGLFVLSCTKNTVATIALDNGQNASQAVGTTRAMLNTFSSGGRSAYLSYEIYKNSARTQVWNTSQPLSFTATTTPANIPVYGTIPASQNPQTGGFVDTILITVNF